MFLKRNDRHLGVGTCKRTEANFSKTLKAAKRAEADPGGGLRGLQPSLWEVLKLVWLSMSNPF